MGKNKKKKGLGAEKTAAKTERKAAKKAKKDARTAGEDDVDAVVAQLEAEESSKCRPLVELQGDDYGDGYRPSPRSGFSWTANPRSQEIYLFGGEQRLPPNGRLRVLNEHLVYRPADNRWTRLGSGTLPTPRCAHQAALAKPSGHSAQLYVFGGEYATPTESQFHHYGDLWSWSVKSRQWRKLPLASGAAPCPRSGHRMTALRRPRLRLLVFGGYQDNGRAFRYLNDLWSYDCDTAAWTEIRAAAPPSPRSACLLFPLPDESGVCVIGGYSKRTEKRAEKGIVHTDCFAISLTAAKASATETLESPQPQSQPQPAAAAWQAIKFSGQRPTPRCGVSGTVNPATGRAYAFGGVFDIEQDDDAMTGVMFNELYQLDLAKQRWRLVDYSGGGGGGSEVPAVTTVAAAAAPCERINAGLAVMDDLLYMYGGIFEGEDDDDAEGDGERTRTLDDLYCLNLKRLEAGWTTLMAATDLGGDDSRGGDNASASSDEDEDDDDEEEEEEGDEADAAAVAASAGPAAGPPGVSAGESADAYAERTGGYWARTVGDSLKRCWSPEDITEALVAKYARRAARDFYWQMANS